MDVPDRSDATRELLRLGAGDPGSADRLLPLVYAELHSLARDLFRREQVGHTLQPTALVHEAWLRLIDGSAVEWRGRAQFRSLAALAMRHVLADHARRCKAEKRGGGAKRATLIEVPVGAESEHVDLLVLDEALGELAGLDPRQHRIVELRFFGGLSVEEVGVVLDVSVTTVEREWRAARAWLSKRLSGDGQR